MFCPRSYKRYKLNKTETGISQFKLRCSYLLWDSRRKDLTLKCLVRSCVFRGNQFTKHSIEFELVETNQLFGSNANVMLTQQTCGQRSGMAAVSKRRALAFYFPYESQSVADSVCCRPHLDVGIAERSTPVQIRWNCTFSFPCSREDDHLW